jgi:CO/xanthine dehydrogenase Mo-binding subunit
MKNAFIGSPIERREDLRFLRGRGEYLDDLLPDGLVYAVILRSSVAHGRIVAIDTAAALKIPGVHAVITAKDMPPTPRSRMRPMYAARRCAPAATMASPWSRAASWPSGTRRRGG